MPLDQEAILRHLFSSRQRLSAAAWLLVRDAQTAEDMFQNVALKALTTGASFDHEGALLSWATVCIRREAIDWLRKRKPETLGLSEPLMDLLVAEDADDETKQHNSADQLQALKSCLEGVAPHSRTLLQLRYFDGRSCQQVADELGLKLDAVYQRLSRLHKHLRQCMEARLSSA